MPVRDSGSLGLLLAMHHGPVDGVGLRTCSPEYIGPGAFYLFVLLESSLFRLVIRLSSHFIVALPDAYGYILL